MTTSPPETPQKSQPESPFDAVVVLGAALAPGGKPGPANTRRAAQGVRMFGCGCAPVMLMSGGYGSRRTPDAAITEARALADLALAADAPAERIVLEETSRRTMENAACCAEIAKARGWRRVLVVTDVFHMPRAVMCFRLAGLDCAGAPVWGWRPGSFTAWLAGWLREIPALGFYLWLAVTGALTPASNQDTAG